MTVLALLLGLVAGAALGWAYARSRSTAEAAAAADALASAMAREAEARTALEYERRANADRDGLAETVKSITTSELQKSTERLIATAHETLRTQTSQADADLARREQAVAALVAPIQERLAQFDTQIRDIETKREGAYRGLVAEVTQARVTTEQLRVETASLVTALRKPQARGQWGELQLRRAVELAGMLERCDFDEQVTVTGADGSSRPDLVVHLPGGRHVVVDSKCPLDGFLETVDCADEGTLRTALQRHARHVRAHIDSLAKKAYASKVDDAADFVVLFLPGEALLSSALDGAADLLEYGAERSVIVATPTTLIALLRSVAFGWRQEALARDAREIAALGREVYDRLSTMGGHLAGLGRSLKSSVDSYNKTVASLESRVLVTARKFEQYRLADDAIAAPAQVEATPSQLQAPELVESAAEVRTVAVLPPGAVAEAGVDDELKRVAGLA